MAPYGPTPFGGSRAYSLRLDAVNYKFNMASVIVQCNMIFALHKMAQNAQNFARMSRRTATPASRWPIRRRSTEAFCDGHTQAFAFFGGVPAERGFDFLSEVTRGTLGTDMHSIMKWNRSTKTACEALMFTICSKCSSVETILPNESVIG